MLLPEVPNETKLYCFPSFLLHPAGDWQLSLQGAPTSEELETEAEPGRAETWVIGNKGPGHSRDGGRTWGSVWQEAACSRVGLLLREPSPRGLLIPDPVWRPRQAINPSMELVPAWATQQKGFINGLICIR